MTPDTFELLATIKSLEKGRNRTVWAGMLVTSLLLWWHADSFTKAESMIFGAVCFVGILLFQEARNSHLQGLRVSLRQLELLRDPSLIHETE